MFSHSGSVAINECGISGLAVTFRTVNRNIEQINKEF